MNKQPTPHKAPPSPTKRRISPKIKEAIRLHVREGEMWKDAAEKADVTYAAVWKARQKQHVQDYERDLKDAYIQEVEAMRAPHKARAFEVARQLLEGAKSEAVKARMVEFLAGESKQNAVNVQINNNLQAPQGYEYVPPGVEIVTVREADKSA